MSPANSLRDKFQSWRRRRQGRQGTPSGLLLISAGGLGDTVLFSLLAPRFAELAEPGESVTVLLRADAAKMGFLLPSDVSVEAVDFQRFRRDGTYRDRVMTELYQANFRRVVATDFLRHPELDEALVAAAETEAFAMTARAWPKYQDQLDNNKNLYARLMDSGPDHVDKVLRWTAFADWLTGSIAPPPKVRLDTSRLAGPAAKPGRRVVIQPFSALLEKQRPLVTYQHLIAALPDDTEIVITGTDSDLDRNSGYRALLENGNTRFDNGTFEAVIPLLRSADLVVSVDTAMMHLAVGVGAPTLCLASAAYVGDITPYALEIAPPNSNFLYKSMPCEGCLGHCVLDLKDGMFPCVAELQDQAITAKALELLGA